MADMPLSITRPPPSWINWIDNSAIMRHPNLKYCITATAIFIMLFSVTFIVLVLFKPIINQPEVLNLLTGDMKLVSVTVLFRHGARAPVVIDNETIAKIFPNGPGEITDVGLRDTFKLGQLLGDRYVKTGFLRTPLLPSEIYFRSRANNRCLFCAAIVGSGMWAKDESSAFTPVPIYAQEKNDNWPLYEGFVYECTGLIKNNSDLFPSAEAFADVESLIQMVNHFIVSVVKYHNNEVLKLKQGFLMNRIMNDLWEQWGEYERHGSVQKKFIAYSTQDWLVMAFLHALGCGEEALGSTIPDFNALVIIELFEQSKKPMVRIHYKDNKMKMPKDITHAVRSCSFAPCHLIQLGLSVKRYRTDDPQSVCNMQIA
ncbi:histidine acid phosphatase [Ancylostoma ceylanicum]|uniref:acid phosphatase n=1 Tax=Ancylostoma ceylanicum TaxID=53326 RepID=A0A0D6LKX1_9BILA|nr:histidine acid phosphatase [Ancylostoma ceylanicum]